MAMRQPEQAAVKIPRGRNPPGDIDYLTLSFAELDLEVDAWVAHLEHNGVRRGDRVLVLVRQGLPLIAAAFALFKLGAVPVIIDPGMGRKNFLACVARSKPRVLLGIPSAQIMGWIFRSAFASVEVRLWVSGSATSRMLREPPTRSARECCNVVPASLAAILFTSGSTGAPKGVCYEHGMFDAQVGLIRDIYGIGPGEVDLPMLPVFALFNPALGMTTVVPELDPSQPAQVDPERIVRAILQEKVTNSFGSPTLWRRIFDHCLARRLTLPGLRRVLCAGAAVPASLWTDAKQILPNGRLHSPYGATEALPVATISSDEIEFRSESGALLGNLVPGNKVKIIAATGRPLSTLADACELPAGETGEIIVTGPTTTKEYDRLPDATALAKISSMDGAVWHRMGDAGSLDATGRLWFTGRLAEGVVTANGILYTEPSEQVFRSHPQVARCALIGLGPPGRQQPALVIQPVAGSADKVRLARELGEMAARHPQTAAIKKFFFHPAFPVDVRHNAKIHRLSLARWAATARAFAPGSRT